MIWSIMIQLKKIKMNNWNKKKYSFHLFMFLLLNSNKKSWEKLVWLRGKVSVLDVRPVTCC